MKFEEASIKGVYRIKYKHFVDFRGEFVKVFNSDIFSELQLETNFKECFYSISQKNVIRGMHFQVPPASHAKLVNVIKGSITDVIVDLRRDSGTYGEFLSMDFNAAVPEAVYIPAGFAHGFISREDGTVVNYMTTTTYNPEYDCGIMWDSFGYDWKTENPVISERDKVFPPLEKFESPF